MNVVAFVDLVKAVRGFLGEQSMIRGIVYDGRTWNIVVMVFNIVVHGHSEVVGYVGVQIEFFEWVMVHNDF